MPSDGREKPGYHGMRVAGKRRHDRLCGVLGRCDRLCPPSSPTAAIQKPDGQWPEGVSGNVNGPRSLKSARALIRHLTDDGRTIIERLTVLGGLSRDPSGSIHPSSVQVRALQNLREILWGKEIRAKVGGTVTHVLEQSVGPTSEQVNKRMSELTDKQLDLLEEFHKLDEKRLELPAGPSKERLADTVDAEFTEVGKDDE